MEAHPELGGCTEYPRQIQGGARRNIALPLDQLIQAGAPVSSQVFGPTPLESSSREQETIRATSHQDEMDSWEVSSLYPPIMRHLSDNRLPEHCRRCQHANERLSAIDRWSEWNESLSVRLLGLQSVPRRHTKIAHLRSIVQIEQLSTGYPQQIWWKPHSGF